MCGVEYILNMESPIYFSLRRAGSLNTAECRLLFFQDFFFLVFNWNVPQFIFVLLLRGDFINKWICKAAKAHEIAHEVSHLTGIPLPTCSSYVPVTMRLLVNAVCRCRVNALCLECLHEWLFEVREVNIFVVFFCLFVFSFIYFVLFSGAKDVLYF